METFEGNTMTTETLGGVFPSSQPTDDSHRTLKPCSEGRVGKDLGSEHEVLCDKMKDDVAAVAAVTTTVIEKTEVSVEMIQEDEVSVVKMIQEDEVSDVKMIQEDDILKNQEEEVFEHSVAEKKEGSEFQESEEKGGFGNLVVDAKGPLAGENVSEVKSDFEGDAGCLADGHEENAGGDPMDICLSGQEEKHENGAEIFEYDEDMTKNEDGNAGEKSTNVGQSLGSLMGFCLSGQEEKQESGAEIFEFDEDMTKNEDGNAGEKLTNVDSKLGMQEIGEDTGSELAQNEEEYDGEQDESEEDHDFVVGDFVWGKIKSHPWWPGQIYDPSDASDYAATMKRKGRLLVAYFGDGSFSWCSPSQLKPFVDSFQEMSDQSDSKKFVNAVQKALEEVGRLVEAELMCKCATVDRVENGYAVNSGIKGGVLVPKGNTIKVLIDQMNPVELLSTLNASATMEPSTKMYELELTVLKSCLSAFYGQRGGYLLPEYHDPKCIEGLEDETRGGILADADTNGPSESAENGDDKLYQRRKQKSVAELLGEGVEDEPKIKRVKTSKDGGSGARSSTGMKRERKRKALVVSVSPESDHESGGVDEETMSSPRQRKKSKYLSPPYTSPIWSGKHSGSGSGSFKEPKAEAEKVPEMAAKQLEDSLKRSSGRKTRSRRRAREGSESQEERKMIIDAAVNVNKVLNGLLRAALDPSSFVEKNKLPAVTEFISSFRRSIFEEGPNYQPEPDGKEDSCMTLVIEFPPEAAVPTKADLLKTYRKFEGLMRKETEIDGSCAFVVFGNISDAEDALTMSLEKKPFGGVKYYLCEENDVKRGSDDLEFIKQKVESMKEIVKRCDVDEISAELKASLEGGMKEVLDKVGKMKAK